jgi:integrase
VKTTHGLRHTFKDALREANIHRDIANMLQGHTAGDAASGYGSSELLEAKRQAAEKVWAVILGNCR